MNKYECKHCDKIVTRDSNKKWIKSECEKTGKTVRLQLLDSLKNKVKTENTITKKASFRKELKELIKRSFNLKTINTIRIEKEVTFNKKWIVYKIEVYTKNINKKPKHK